MFQGRPVSIATLLASGVTPRPHEAVAIVLQLCGQLSAAGRAPVVMPAISTSTVTIEEGGQVAVAGGTGQEDEQTVSLAGRLLVEMLDHSAGETQAAVPPRLRAAALRAASDGRQAFASAAAFAAALRRHGPEYGEAEAIRGLFGRWQSAAATGPGVDPPAVADRVADRRRGAPPPDMMRRFLREAEQDAFKARLEASLRPASAVPPGQPSSGGHRSRVLFALLVAVTLLVLAGVGFVFLGGTPGELPFVAPVSKPTPALPRRQPAWELLRRPERAAISPDQVSSPRLRAPGASPDLVVPMLPAEGVVARELQVGR